MDELNLMVAAVAGLVLATGAVSVLVRKVWLTELMLATALGVLLGPACFDLLNPAHWGEQQYILEQAARFTLAIGLMAVALRPPRRYLRTQWRPISLLLGPVMLMMWGVSGGLVWLLFDVSFWQAALVGAVITPTDPVLASSVVTGDLARRHLPKHVRHIVSSESGINDGLAYLFVMLAILMLDHSADDAVTHWLARSFLVEILGGALFGGAIGYAAGRALRWAEVHRDIEHTAYLGFTVALSLTTLGTAKLIGTNDLLAVFVGGRVFVGTIPPADRIQEEQVQETVNRFFLLPVFVLLGLSLPWPEWLELGWKAPALVAMVLVLRRLPAVLLLKPALRPLRDWPSALFVGWFGPVGVAAVFYAMLAERESGLDLVWTIGSLIVVASIVVHGITATPFTEWYGRRSDRNQSENDEPEPA